MVSSSLVRSRAIAVLLPFPQNVHGTGSLVSFIENAHIAILASDSKLSFWAAWTVMNNCRSRFGWQSAQLKESAISRVVERQVTPDLPDHVVLVPPLLVHRCWFRRCWFRRGWFRRCWFRRGWFRRCWFRRGWFRRCWFRRGWFHRCWFRRCWLNPFHRCWFRRGWFRRYWFRRGWFRRCWFRRGWFRRCWFHRCWFHRCWFHRCWFRRHGCWYRRCFFSGDGSAAGSSSCAGTDGATSTASRLLFSGLPSEVSSLPAVVVKTISGFFSCRPPYCQADASSLVFSSTGGIQARMFIKQYSLQYFLILTEYIKNLNKNAHSRAD